MLLTPARLAGRLPPVATVKSTKLDCTLGMESVEGIRGGSPGTGGGRDRGGGGGGGGFVRGGGAAGEDAGAGVDVTALADAATAGVASTSALVVGTAKVVEGAAASSGGSGVEVEVVALPSKSGWFPSTRAASSSGASLLAGIIKEWLFANLFSNSSLKSRDLGGSTAFSPSSPARPSGLLSVADADVVHSGLVFSSPVLAEIGCCTSAAILEIGRAHV